MASIRRLGRTIDFVDSGNTAPLSEKDAKKIDDAYARSKGYKNQEDYLEHKDDPTTITSWIILIAVIILILAIGYFALSFIWDLIAPSIGGMK